MQVDTNKGGKILFEEFCTYMAKEELKATEAEAEAKAAASGKTADEEQAAVRIQKVYRGHKEREHIKAKKADMVCYDRGAMEPAQVGDPSNL